MVIWRKAMWKVHVVDLGKLFRIWRVVEKLIQSLTRRKYFRSKTDNMKKFLVKIMLIRKSFSAKSCFLKVHFSSKSCFLKLHVKRKNCAFYGVNWVETWFFVCKTLFKIRILKIIFSSKSCFLKIYFSWNSWILKTFPSSKSDAS